MSLFPRLVGSDFAPMFRLMDDYANHVTSRAGMAPSALSNIMSSFTPRFDVKETKDVYELHGELPGVEQKNIEITFTDRQTLTIKGRTEHTREEGERPAGFIEGEGEQARLTSGESNGYHKPSVEEEGGKTTTEGSKSTEMTKSAESTEVSQPQKRQRYWLSERSVGEFSRSFVLPEPVDQDAVKASLKNGILSVVVPKAAPPKTKRINIE